MTLTVSEVEDALRLADISWWELAYEDHVTDHLVIHGEVYPLSVEDSKVGHEGDWETSTYVVINVGDQYFRKTGYYASHHGGEWDGDLTEVAVAWKNVQVWEDK